MSLSQHQKELLNKIISSESEWNVIDKVNIAAALHYIGHLSEANVIHYNKNYIIPTDEDKKRVIQFVTQAMATFPDGEADKTSEAVTGLAEKILKKLPEKAMEYALENNAESIKKFANHLDYYRELYKTTALTIGEKPEVPVFNIKDTGDICNALLALDPKIGNAKLACFIASGLADSCIENNKQVQARIAEMQKLAADAKAAEVKAVDAKTAAAPVAAALAASMPFIASGSPKHAPKPDDAANIPAPGGYWYGPM